MTKEIAIAKVSHELEKALVKFPMFASSHEGYAILLEEVDELWDEVKKKPDSRSRINMQDEAMQVAAMAIRFMVECC